MKFKTKEKIEPKSKNLQNTENIDYREIAELVLQRFKCKKVEEMNDEEILMEFSKLSDPNAEFDASVSYPSGSILKCRPTSRIDGIIWANRYCPEFVNVVVSDKEWLNIWNKEKSKKVNNQKFVEEAFTVDKIIEKLLSREKEFLTFSSKNNDTVNKINLTKLIQILIEIYNEEILNGIGVSVPSALEVLNIIADMNYYTDFSDLIANSEQEVSNNKKITYVEFSESDIIDISEILNDFNNNDDEEDDDEDIFNNEEEEDNEEYEDDDIFG